MTGNRENRDSARQAITRVAICHCRSQRLTSSEDGKKNQNPKKDITYAKIHEGINPVTGYKYRRYTMIRLKRRRE